MEGRRFYWLKLPEDFFRRGYIRRLRGREDGDRLVLVYLEMLLASLKTGGTLTGEPGEDLAEELGLELYEDPSDVETVLNYLSERGKIFTENDAEYHLTDSDEMTGSEGISARRVRESRRREKEEIPCGATVPAAPAAASVGAPRTFTDEEFAKKMAGLRRN